MKNNSIYVLNINKTYIHFFKTPIVINERRKCTLHAGMNEKKAETYIYYI